MLGPQLPCLRANSGTSFGYKYIESIDLALLWQCFNRSLRGIRRAGGDSRRVLARGDEASEAGSVLVENDVTPWMVCGMTLDE